jgi:hypothetical protein
MLLARKPYHAGEGLLILVFAYEGYDVTFRIRRGYYLVNAGFCCGGIKRKTLVSRTLIVRATQHAQKLFLVFWSGESNPMSQWMPRLSWTQWSKEAGHSGARGHGVGCGGDGGRGA